MKKSVIIILAVIAVIVIWAVSMYNGLVAMDEKVNGQWANVENSIPTPRRFNSQSGKYSKRVCDT